MEDTPAQPRAPQEPTPPGTEAPVAGDGSEQEKPMEEATSSREKEKEKEEEEAFLISLYKFMKDRHTPIERIPHLGFKQINLWKIYKAVEKLGAYELVTGRRLWKNVYDELGGSPGSTSAATCTRRHYERLVLPYVRHLKGEDDKPLPPSKPRKQYKVSKGTETGEKGKRSKKEKGREQMPPDKAKPEAAAGLEDAERGRGAEGCSSLSPLAEGPDPCRTHSETYKRLFSSFSSKGNHPIMSPLAKKKLLAQVSKAESLHCPKRPNGDTGPSPKPLATSSHLDEQRSPEPAGAQDTAPGIRSEVGAMTSTSHAGRDSQRCPRAEDGGPVPAVFTGCFHAYRSEVLPPGRCPPLWGCFSSLKDFLEPPSSFPPRAKEQEQPQDLRSKAGQPWSGDRQQVATVKGCWVPPSASITPMRGKHGREEEEEEEEEDEEEEEGAFGPSVKLRAVSPFIKEADGRDMGRQQGLAKPKAVVATPGYATRLPQAPDAYKGAMLHFPASFGNPLEHLKTQGVPVAASLSMNPFIIPAFPSPLVATSDLCTGPRHYTVSYESSLRHRHYPAATWQSQPPYSPRHVPAFHRHTKL